MKPPTQEAVDQAVRILIESINEQNKTSFATHQSEQAFDHCVGEFDTTDKALRMVHESITSTTKLWMARVRKRRNGLIPIAKLPVEVIAEILLASLSVKNRSNMKHLRGLAGVTIMWRDVILSTPRFWTTISSADAVALKLRRSGTTALTVALHNVTQAASSGVVKLLEPHLDRCKTLQCSRYSASTLAPYLRTHRPQLTSLVITDMWRFFLPSAAELLGVLSSSPHLEILELTVDATPMVDTEPEGQTPERITSISLGRLKRLALHMVGLKRSQLLIRGIQAKNLLVFHLTELGVPEVPMGVGSSALQEEECGTMVRDVIRNNNFQALVIDMGGGALYIQGAGDSRNLQISYNSLSPHVLRSLHHLLVEHMRVQLRIETIFGELAEEVVEAFDVIASTLQRKLRVIQIQSYYETTMAVLRRLAIPDRESIWVAPALKTLTVHLGWMNAEERESVQDLTTLVQTDRGQLEDGSPLLQVFHNAEDDMA